AAYMRAITCRALRADGAELPTYQPDPWSQPCSFADATLVDGDGTSTSFLWPALPPGIYRVEVHAPGIAAPLAAVDGLHVPSDGAADPRLDPIDARAAARTLRVSLVPVPSGPRPVTDGGAIAFASGSQPRTMHGLLFDAAGQAQMLVGVDPVDVLVAIP